MWYCRMVWDVGSVLMQIGGVASVLRLAAVDPWFFHFISVVGCPVCSLL